MRVLARTDDYVHNVRAGSEVSLHHVVRYLQRAGHAVQVLAEDRSTSRSLLDFDSVPVLVNPSPDELRCCYEWADVVLTQQAVTPKCLREAEGLAPVVFFCHVRGQERLFLKTGDASLVVFNSEWLALESRHLGPTAVVHPSVFFEDYEVEPEKGGGGVLQVNLSENKGGPLFWWLASHLPHRKFLAGIGTWGEQRVPGRVPPNVTVLPRTADVRGHYAKASVVIMPSTRETYGRVALEAACSGIPSVVSPTPGLKEALGDSALYADPTSPEAWVEALHKLENPEFYAQRSALALARAELAEARSRVELAGLEQALLSVASNSRARVWAFASEEHYVDHTWAQLACVDPRQRGPLVVPPLVNGPQSPALIRAWRAGAYVLRLPVIRSRSQQQEVLSSTSDPDQPGSVCLVVSERDRTAAEAWFPGRVVRGEHGAGQSYSDFVHNSFPGGKGHAGCLAAMAPCESVAAKIRAANPGLFVAVTGQLRLHNWSKVPVIRGGRTLLVLSFRYPGTGGDCQELEPAFDHYRQAEFPSDWEIAVHLHPRATGGEVETWARSRGYRVIREFGEVVQTANVFAVDNSSSAVEWYHLRQGQLVLLNSPQYRRWKAHGLRFWDMLEWKGVHVADHPDELLPAAEQAAAEGPVEEAAHWFAQTEPARLRNWLTSLLRPATDVRRVRAISTFEGRHGRIRGGSCAWLPVEYAEAVAAKGLAVILQDREPPAPALGDSDLPEWYPDEGLSQKRWKDLRLWQT